VDRSLTERLVGAAVLIAIAVIVIPELLSGPSSDSVDGAIDAPDETVAGLKTYTIDLSRPGQDPAETDVAGSVPEPGEVAAVSAGDAAAPDETVRDSAEPVPAPPPESTRQVAAATAQPAARQPAPPPASTAAPAEPAKAAATTPRDGDWAVQVGSFSSRPAAEKIASQFQGRGYHSYITEYRSGGRTLHRVRLGPVANRAQADAMVRKLKSEGTSATVVSNP
jgi:DedD protein